MRNSTSARMRSADRIMLVLLLALMAGGCAASDKAKAELREGYNALEQRQYDEAIARADAFLRRSPTGSGSAEALYLRGRAFEQRLATSPHDARANLQSARNSYIEALQHSPSPKLETYVHTSLANVAYFQDDYSAAASHWTVAYDRLDDDAVKSWVLYRVGLCRQRLGQFADADAVFAAVQQRYPNTVPAQRAREHQGARGFSVQLATFASSASADAAINDLRRQGILATRQADRRGRHVVMVGPLPSYQQAQSLKLRYVDKYPDAVIVP